MIRKTLFLFMLLAYRVPIIAQTRMETYSNSYRLQYGFSLKAVVELGLSRYQPKPVFRFSANAGAGSNFLASWLYPSLNIEFLFYNGGLGSRNEGRPGHAPWDLDIISALTFTGGGRNHFTAADKATLEHRNIPLYYFADFVYPALQNPFDYSFSVGTNVIFTPLNNDKKNQRIGFINAHVQRFQVCYYNDGGVPIYNTYLGDRRDRYYTGGGVLSYAGNAITAVNLVELSYHKFTGYTKNAFEVSNKFYLGYMNYHREEQKYYNKSLWNLNIANPAKGFGLKISSYNDINLDLQHKIHWGLFNAYHIVPYKPYFSVAGIYYNGYTKMGIP